MLLIAVIAGLVIFAVIRWRIKMALQHVVTKSRAANDNRGLFNLRGWLARRKDARLRRINDVREAATHIMVAVAEADGGVTEAERGVIVGNIMKHFDATREIAEKFLKRARGYAKEPRELARAMHILLPVIRSQLDQREKQELLVMLRQVAEADGQQDERIIESIVWLKRNIA